MSSRALRKLQREQELQKQIAAAKEAEEEVEESEDEEPHTTPEPSQPKNAFDMLEDVDDDDDASDEADGVPLPTKTSQTPQQPSTSMPRATKKKKKKAKKKAKDNPSQTSPGRQNSGDEIDQALKELAAKRRTGDAAQDEEDLAPSWEVGATKQLAIDTKNLNPTNEMRSLFGNVALEGEARSTPRNQPQNQRRREQNEQGGVDLATALTGRYSPASRGKELGNLANRRNVFMQGKEEWPLAASGGLSMEPAPDPLSFEKKYNIVHNDMYQETQRKFRMGVESMDPQQMIGLLMLSPYHIATLLQVSEIAKHQGDHSVSGDLLERALFSLGRSVHSSFPMAMREGTARLSFDRGANRELYLTIWRYIRNLEMRGTWKTAFEWCKLLLQLNTLSDPYGVTLMIDQLALRGRSHGQFLKLASDEAYGNAWRHLPNIQISLVLAHLRSKQGRDARKQLALCIHHYPYIISAIASSLDISPLPKKLWAKLPSTDAEKLYTELYVSRAKDLWNTPEASALIVEVADTMQYYTSTTSSAPQAPKLEISLEEARHIFLLETPSLLSLLPRRFTSLPTSSFDVLPPPRSSDDSDFTARAPTDGSGVSIMQNIMNAGAATAGATGNTVLQSLMNFRNWFQRPATNDTADNTAADEQGQAALRDLQRDLEAQGMPPEMIEHFVNMQLTDAGPDDEHEHISLDDLGMANGMAGAFEYYPDSDDYAAQDDTDTGDSMPSLEDIPTQETRPTAAPTPPLQPRNPHAATVEEGEDEEELDAHGRTAAGRAILRHVDSDDDDNDGTGADADTILPHPYPTHTLFPSHPAPRFQPDRNSQQQPLLRRTSASTPHTSTSQTRAQISTEAESMASIENDPQRLQRYLLTTGFTELQSDSSHVKVLEYARRLKILRKQQQSWILNMITQRDGSSASKEAVERVRRELGEA